MDGNIGLLLLLQVVLIGLNAIFASAEIAVLSISEVKLERLAEDGNKKAKRLWKLTREPAKFLATIQVAITLSGFLGSAFAADNFAEPLVDWVISLGVSLPRASLETVAVILITLILSYFTLIFGELVPKRLAMKRSESVAMGISGLVSGISVVFKPIVAFLSVSTNLVLRLCGIDPNEAEEEASEEEIRMMVDVGSEKGTIDHQEKEFIQNVFEFNDTTAAEIATHRTDVTILWLEDDDATWEQIIHDSRHTRYPICDETPDKVVGVLNAKDYFRLTDRSRMSVMENAVRPPYFVSELVKADVLFRNLKQTRNPMAIVMDEYGGMVGIVTVNDLIEELVGELTDELEENETVVEAIEQIGERTWRVTGNAQLRELSEAMEHEFEEKDYDTLSGLVFDAIGTIPDDGAQDIELELEGLKIHVTAVESHQIAGATITILDTLPDTPDEEL